jgi:hypothetical protein
VRARARVILGLAALTAPAGRAHALDAFEIQVYDGTANPPGAPGLEVHVNDVARGVTAASPPELAPDHQAHFTLEPSYGVRPWWELGGYLQTALRADGVYEFAGAKLRSKLVTTSRWSTRARLGVNVEVSALPRRYEAAGWGLEVRPIAAWGAGHFAAAVNPIVGVPLTGGPATFEPAAEALLVWPGRASVGLEYYAGLGALTGWARAGAQEHYLFEVVNLLAVDAFELNAGVGEGLTAASNPLVVKLIVGYVFEARPR